ncbi:unnamed protein product [Bemisia tabaci]|uniref:Cadherin domain-containing protein n=1 Tax=Bemisia tabaci TaxID=7038 RepID=A0A9P0AGX4_BEMTA|nr:unnamed protein product [Bemisia tabaci]
MGLEPLRAGPCRRCSANRVRRKFRRLELHLWLAVAFAAAYCALPAAANRPPKFIIDGQTEIVLRLKEGEETPVGSLIYRLRGVDPDNDQLTFGVKDPSSKEVLRIENLGTNEANVYLNKELDREVQDEYAVVLTLTDGRLGEGNFITQSLLLLVEDVNDNEPIFKPYQSTISVREDAPPGVLTTVEATDADEGPYGQVVYHIQELDGEDHLFSVSTVNGKGVIRLVGQLDYERKFLHQLRVLAVDRSNNDRVNTGTAAILVKVQDVEDQPPEFVVVVPVTRVSEDVKIGTSISQVKAVDGDRGVNNRISYAITSGGQGIFDINSMSGAVFTIQKLDRESANSNNGAYILEITAREESHEVFPAPEVKTEITVIVTDVNDEVPTFRSARYVAEINENAQVNTAVSFIGPVIPQVFDYDQGNNGTFMMFIDGNQDTFEVTPPKGINEASFLIRVKNPTKLDYEEIKVMNFTLVAKETVPKFAKFSVVPITIHIRDMNDNFPEFSKPLYEVYVPENSAAGRTLAWISAHDEDSGDFGTKGIRYTSIGGSIADTLALDPLTGVITIKTAGPAFDREQIARHYLTVEARDDLGRGNRNTVQIIVNVNDVNDNAPRFYYQKYEARLLENQDDFDVPLKIEAYDLDLNGTDNSRITYTIVKTNTPVANFTIDPATGTFKPVKAIDFEELAAFQDDESIKPVRAVQVLVRATDHGSPPLSSDVVVTVYIQDTNDHAPVFDRSSYGAAIPEDLASGTSVLQVQAKDSDGSSPNNVIVFRIQNGASDKFVVDASTGVISVAKGASLDPDSTDPKTKEYTLTIVALDGGIGSEQRQTTVQAHISIEDVNNKPPVILDPGAIAVRENTQVGTFIHRIVAIDPDEKPVLRYHIDPENSEARSEEGTIVKGSEFDFINAFHLNPLDGLLRVVRLLDREKVENIRLAIHVEDLAATRGKQTAAAIINIVVEDENDNSPAFKKPFYRRSIPENSQQGTPIVSVLATDPDKNRTIKYGLEGSAAVRDLIHLDTETGELVVGGKVDREATPWLNMSVKATDNGVPPRSSFVDVFVQVLDENDNNPYFVDTTGLLNIPENTPIGTEVASIEARDADVGDYGRITYLLDRISSHGKFAIDPNTGILTVADKLDREQTSSYNLIVEAWDNYQFGYASGESRNAFKQLAVSIIDENDNAPEFDSIPDGCISVTEFHDIGEPVFILKGSDKDDPSTLNGRINFAILSGNEQGLFGLEKVDQFTSKIMSRSSLKGRYGNYTLVIRIQDLGTPSNVAMTDLKICVSDFNDHAPRFVSPSHNITIRIPENATEGSSVIRVEATDDDVGLNAEVRYRLKHDLSGDYRTFAINDTTGQITLRLPLNREKQKIYQIRVEAYDLGLPTPLTADLDLVVYVRSVNDHQPQFLIDEFTINFTEHEKPGSERVKLVDTVDRDRDEMDEVAAASMPICYYIVAGNDDGYFNLEPLSHQITVVRELDREVADSHVLIIKALEDCTHAPMKKVEFFDPHDDTTLRVVINVLDINDNPPKFISPVFTGGITTETDFGTEFMQVQAIDLDSGLNAKIEYSLHGGVEMTLTEGLDIVPQMTPFLVDPTTGGVVLNFDPQKGMKGYFDFTVAATDISGLKDTAQVFIYLLREDQRVRFVLRQQPSELRDKIHIFREVLGNVTGAIVNVDEYKIHETSDGRVDKTRSDMYLHFVSRKDNSVLEVEQVLHLIDLNIEKLDSLFKDFNVLDTQAAELVRTAGTSDNVATVWLIGTTIFLSLLLLVIVCLCLAQRARYRRQLKAATVTAFSSTDSDMTRVTNTGRVPNTNKHSVEGSNPIWMQAYENEWYKEDDSGSQASERDSLDENIVSVVNHDVDTGGSSCNSRSNIIQVRDSVSIKDQNDLNTKSSSLYHQNLYHHLEKLGNPLITKKLETTEL